MYENSPKIFTDEQGKASGIFVDVLNDIAKEENWELEYINVSWNEGLALLESNDLDLMPDVAYTPNRALVYDFHYVPVISSWSQVFARKGSGIRSILDLNGKKISVLEGSVHQQAFLELAQAFDLNVILLPYQDLEPSLEAVSSGVADATIVNFFYGMTHTLQYNMENTAVVFNPSQLFFAAAKGKNADLLKAIDKHLSVMKNNPNSAYYQALKRWTGEEVEFTIPDWVKIAIIVIITALVFVTIATFVLKKQVQLKTAELRRSNREMEQRIIERTAELAEAMEKAQAADRIKSAFLATMSHELRTPLNSIIGFTGIILQELPGPLNDEQKKQLGMVRNSSRHLLSLINDVLDISKIEAGQLDLFYSKFDLRESIQNTIRIVSPIAEKKGVEIRTQIADNICIISSDKRHLEQVILNLLSNAIKFTEKGYVRLECKMLGEQCQISVTDTGIGIPQNAIPALFQPFSQIDSGLTRKYEGTGLGLSISKKLMDMMLGSISVSSTFHKGSTFTIQFPINEDIHYAHKNSTRN